MTYVFSFFIFPHNVCFIVTHKTNKKITPMGCVLFFCGIFHDPELTKNFLKYQGLKN